MAINPTTGLEEEDTGGTMNVLGQGPQKESTQQYQQQADQATTVSGQAPATVGTDQASPEGPEEPASSGLFTNIRKFVEANKGAGQQIAGTAQQQVGQRAEDVGQAVQQKQQKLQSGIQKATTQATEAEKAARGALTAAKTTGELTPEQIEQYRGAATGQAFAETPEFDITKQQEQAQDIARQAEEAQTAPGRFGLLREFFGTPEQRYGRGLQRLDTAFLQQDPTARQDIATGLGKISRTAEGELTAAEEAALGEEGLIPTYQTLTGDIRTGLETGLTTAQEDIESDVLTRGQQALAERDALVDRINAALETEEGLAGLSPEDQVALGITAPETTLQDISGGSAADLQKAIDVAQEEALLRGIGELTPAELLTGMGEYAPGDEALMSRFATEEDVARYGALGQLAGMTPEELEKYQAGEGLGEYAPGFRADDITKESVSTLVDDIVKQQTGGMGLEDYTEQALASGNAEAVPVFHQQWNAAGWKGVTEDQSAKLLQNIMPSAANPTNAQALQMAYQAQLDVPSSWYSGVGDEYGPGPLKPEIQQMLDRGEQLRAQIEQKTGGGVRNFEEARHLASRWFQEDAFRRQAIENLRNKIYG